MICAVCNCVCSQASSYRLGELDGDVCVSCQEGLADAVRRFVVRRTREVTRSRWHDVQIEKREARLVRETYPRGLRLVGGKR